MPSGLRAGGFQFPDFGLFALLIFMYISNLGLFFFILLSYFGRYLSVCLPSFPNFP